MDSSSEGRKERLEFDLGLLGTDDVGPRDAWDREVRDWETLAGDERRDLRGDEPPEGAEDMIGCTSGVESCDLGEGFNVDLRLAMSTS